jgi:hypothetical protein
MEPGKEYAIKVRETTFKGKKESFLRIRTGKDVLDSGIASGCGDYASAFIYLCGKQRLKTMCIDSIDLSIASFISIFSGHVFAAVYDAERRS